MMTNNIHNVSLSSLILSDQSGFKRHRSRSEAYRGPNYDEQYDFHTVFFDAFYDDTGSFLNLIAPPLINLEDFLRKNIRFVGKTSAIDCSDISIEHLRNCDWVKIPVPESLKGTTLKIAVNHAPDVISTSNVELCRFDIFAHHRVVFTMLKYDHIGWIEDWAEFYVKAHGADAFLIYNNNSPYVTDDEIQAVIGAIPGVNKVLVVNWPFPYGPQADGTGLWDSDFCQSGMLAHARYRFLGKAKSVLNIDIDELLVSREAKSIFEYVEDHDEGYAAFHGIWTAALENAFEQLELRKHKHYFYHGNVGDVSVQCPSKWAAVPEKIDDKYQWTAHEILSKSGPIFDTAEFRYRHFRHLNAGWKKDRSKPLQAYNIDNDLISIFKKIGWL